MLASGLGCSVLSAASELIPFSPVMLELLYLHRDFTHLLDQLLFLYILVHVQSARFLINVKEPTTCSNSGYITTINIINLKIWHRERELS